MSTHHARASVSISWKFIATLPYIALLFRSLFFKPLSQIVVLCYHVEKLFRA